jgi:DNA-binding response OmpR family regulator
VEPQRLLVIDDDASLREGLALALCPPYRVLTAASGPAALALLRTTPVDLILLDVLLGAEDGLELLPDLRALSAAPVLVLTAFGTHENLVRIIRAKPDDFLEKPFGLPEILTRAAALLGRRGAEPDPLDSVRARIEREYDRRLSLTELARVARLHPARLRRSFTRRFGMSPAAYLAAVRMRRAATLLTASGRLVKEIAASVGYPNANNFTTAFTRVHGIAPGLYRRRGRPPIDASLRPPRDASPA